jgi:hypothetical protein
MVMVVKIVKVTSQVEEEGQGHSLAHSDYKSGFIRKDMENYHVRY